MRLHNRTIQDLFVIGIFALCVGFAYRYLPQMYFSHDEWRQLAGVLINGIWNGLSSIPIPNLLFGNRRALGFIINSAILYFFPFKSYPFIVLFYVGHAANAFLLYRLVSRLAKNRGIGFVAALFFAIASRHQQALTWIGAGVEAIGSLFFLLLALNVYVAYWEQHSAKKLILSALLLYISYLFKEDVLFIPIVVTIAFVSPYSAARKHVKLAVLLLSTLLGTIGIFPALRLFGSYTTNPQGFTGTAIVLKQLLNIVFYPLVSLGQYFLPYRFVYKAADWVLREWYPFMNTGGNMETLLHFPLADMVSLIASFIVATLFGIVAVRDKKHRPLILMASVYYIASFFPIAFHLIHRYDSYIESRYMYVITPAVAVLFACCVYYAWMLCKKQKKYAVIGKALLVCIVGIYLFKEATVTQREVKVYAIQGNEMTGFMRAMQTALPKVPKHMVLLIEGDRTYYYDYNSLPFLLGAGYIVGIIYYPGGTIPPNMLQKETLIGFGSQGVVNDGKKLFGYYWNRNDLKRDLQTKHEFSSDQVMAFTFTSTTNTITDETKQIRDFLDSP
ncbi:MAG: hypothetical protein NT149_02600 [Candidatus Gottesmanbacteria bacterium]|nr:hypothetical protein [Candidatus Gottesmanbacteria bacterium]